MFQIGLPLRASFRTSTGELTDATHLLARVVTADGIVGWGECPCELAPNFGPETLETCWHVLGEFLIPSVLGFEWEEPRELTARLDRFRGNNFAKAALDAAAWDVYAQASSLSLSAALGGTRTEIESGVSVGIQATVEQAIAEAARVVGGNYKRLKLKIVPGMAEELVRAVQTVTGEVPIVVDANGGFPPRGRDELVRLDEYQLAMIEQPFAPEQLLLHRDLAEEIATPICLDESVPSVAAVSLALDLGAASIINVKVSRLGGLTEARAAHDACFERGIPVWCGGMHEFGIGRAANIALASLSGFVLPGDVSASEERYQRDIVNPPITADDGVVKVPTGLGLGVDVDEELVDSFAVRRRTFGFDPTAVSVPVSLEGGTVPAPS